LPQAVAPFGKNRSDLVRVFFVDELVETGLSFQKQGIEGPLAAVARVEIEPGACRGWSLARRKRQIAQEVGPECGRRSLNEKVTAAGVQGKIRRLLFPAQTRPPGDSVKPKLAVVKEERQGNKYEIVTPCRVHRH